MPMVDEFKKFILRGNVMDLAVGVIVGGAFGKITTSLVDDIIMPPIGLLVGRVDFSELFVPLALPGGKSYPTIAAAKAAGVVTINYGMFLNTLINFLIISFAVFLMVQQVNKLHAKPAQETVKAPDTKDCPFCFSKIAIKAIRCPQCTSEVPAQPATA